MRFGGGGSGGGHCSSSPEDEVVLLDSLQGKFGIRSGGAGWFGGRRGGRGSAGASSGRGTAEAGWLLTACTMLVTTDDGNVLRGGPSGGTRGLGGCCTSADWEALPQANCSRVAAPAVG